MELLTRREVFEELELLKASNQEKSRKYEVLTYLFDSYIEVDKYAQSIVGNPPSEEYYISVKSYIMGKIHNKPDFKDYIFK